MRKPSCLLDETELGITYTYQTALTRSSLWASVMLVKHQARLADFTSICQGHYHSGQSKLLTLILHLATELPTCLLWLLSDPGSAPSTVMVLTSSLTESDTRDSIEGALEGTR